MGWTQPSIRQRVAVEHCKAVATDQPTMDSKRTWACTKKLLDPNRAINKRAAESSSRHLLSNVSASPPPRNAGAPRSPRRTSRRSRLRRSR
eukprot:177140-Pleurochrysis_carterae.AAC.5